MFHVSLVLPSDRLPLYGGHAAVAQTQFRLPPIMHGNTSAHSVVEFWLEPAPESAEAFDLLQRRWFRSNSAYDAEIQRRFGTSVADALRGEYDHWADDAKERLALIILLDQFPRNLYRGTRDAFAGDERALSLAMTGMKTNLEEILSPLERVFFCMPLQHAESIAVQEQSVTTFDELAKAECAEYVRRGLEGFADYARQHRDIVRRFGRFPHRNAILGRNSTSEEIEFLESGGATFGQ
jgi:uncharacterized protein (DUF924 family)